MFELGFIPMLFWFKLSRTSFISINSWVQPCMIPQSFLDRRRKVTGCLWIYQLQKSWSLFFYFHLKLISLLLLCFDTSFLLNLINLSFLFFLFFLLQRWKSLLEIHIAHTERWQDHMFNFKIWIGISFIDIALAGMLFELIFLTVNYVPLLFFLLILFFIFICFK